MEREKALRYLETSNDPKAINTLIEGLEDVDHGVRWTAAEVLAAQGEPPFKYLLEELSKPNDIMLRNCAKVVIHKNSSENPKARSKDLLEALSGPGADISTREAATRMLIDWQ